MASTEIESSSVKVLVRLRPMNDDEKMMGVTPAISASTVHKTVTAIKGHGMTKVMYSFNNVYTAYATQQEVFDESISGVIDDVMKGYTSTVLAYGQTGTGKTHTMEGDVSNPATYGVIPRSIIRIFETLEQPKIKQSRVTISYLEIYNEELSDLFADGHEGEKLEILNGRDGTCCRGLIEKEVKTLDEVITLIQKAVQSRKIGETKMNKESSRSHCIFTVHVYARAESSDGSPTDYHGKLHMVDLAGSENAKSAEMGSRKSPSGSTRERERKNINTSLLTLGRVISAVKSISQGKRNIRVPYRDSKLTRVLQDSLGGRSKTVIIATVSPSDIAISESISTLNYAQAANGIINKPIADSHHVSKLSVEYNAETNVEQWYEMECKIKYMEAQIEEAQVALARKNQQHQVLVDKKVKSDKKLAKAEKALHQAVERIDELDNALNQEKKTTISLSHELNLVEASLMRTDTILHATQQTEENLTAEALLLIQTVQTSINDGDRLHNLLIDERQRDLDRKAATKVFHTAAVSVLKEIHGKMQNIVKGEEMFCKSIARMSSEDAKAGQQSLFSTVDALKEINSNVKIVVGMIKDLCSKDNGLLSIVEFTASQIHSTLSKGAHDMNVGKENLSAASNIARNTLAKHAQEFQSLGTNATEDTSNILLSLTSKIDATKTEILDNANTLLSTTSKLAKSSSEARKQLTEALSDIEEKSMITMQGIGECALQHDSQARHSMKTFTKGMTHLHEAQITLQKEKSFLTKRGNMQVDDISSQGMLLSRQSKTFADSQQKQKKTQAGAMSAVMEGLQKLLENEFAKLDKENETHFSTFTLDNTQIVDLNEKIGSSTRNIMKAVATANDSLTTHVDLLSKNDKFILDEVEKSNETVKGMKKIADEHYCCVREIGKSAKERVDELNDLDIQLENTMSGFNHDKSVIAEHLSVDVRDFAKEGFEKMIKNGAVINEFITNEVIPPAIHAIDRCENECGSIFSDISNNYAQIQEFSTNGHAQTKGAINELCINADKLQQTVTSKCSSVHKTVVAVRRKEIEESNAKTIDKASLHLKTAKADSAIIQGFTASISEQISTNVKDVINAHTETPPVPSKTQIQYNDQLSCTPAEHLIIGTLDLKLESLQDENTRMMSPMRMKSIQKGLPISPLSLVSMGNNPPERSRSYRV